MSLKWNGTGIIPGIPARDLSNAEINDLEREHPEVDNLELALIGTGYYEKALEGAKSNKAVWPQTTNK
jgi:hypothetical protein